MCRAHLNCLLAQVNCDNPIFLIKMLSRIHVTVPGVRSGRAIVEGTRIGVHDVVAMIQTGATVDEVVASFPRMSRAQVYECLAYYEDHKSEIDPLVAAQTAHADE